MMKIWNLQIELKSDLCSATGESSPGMINCKTALEYGVPYIPAKRLKGCLLEAGREMADNGVIEEDTLYRIFGRPGMDRGEGIRISNGHVSAVPNYLFGYEDNGKFAVGEYEEFQKYIRGNADIDDSLIEDIFTRKRTRTALEEESRTAKEHSLRTIQVVPAEMVFSSCIEGELSQKEEEVLFLCVKGLRHMGIGITRGLGEVRCVLKQVCQEDAEITNQDTARLRTFSKEEEVSVSFEIELKMPTIMAGGSSEGVNQISASEVLGALAGMYIKRYSLGNKAHEDESFRRIFLRDGVQFGNAYLKKGDLKYVICPKALAVKKVDRTAWFNILHDNQQTRRKSISGQIFLEGINLYTASPEKEIHFHHARPLNRGIAHALNDRADDTTVPTGQFFQYIALSKGQTFAGTWKGKADDIRKLVECLEEQGGSLMLGKSRTAEYGKCIFRVTGINPAEQPKGSSSPTKEWFFWLLSPAVFQNKMTGEYDTRGLLLLEQMKKELDCDIELIKSICGCTVIDGYNSRWRMPAAACPALAAGSAFYIKTDKEIEAWEIEGRRWGMLTGKGCGEVKAVPWNDSLGGTAVSADLLEENVLQEENEPSGVKYNLITEIHKYKIKRQEREGAALRALDAIDDLKVNKLSSSDISLLIQLFKENGEGTDCYEKMKKDVNYISEEKKKMRIQSFIKPCEKESAAFMKYYLENAKWKMRTQEEENE